MANLAKTINASEVKSFIESIKDGVFFSMHFERVAPKCLKCNKANKNWNGLDICPVCGEPLSYERETIAQKGVKNPADHIKLTGTGISAKEALENMNVVKYYDVNAVDNKGNKGGYRSTRVENIKRITYEKVDYFVI
jgi:hypothetical protein